MTKKQDTIAQPRANSPKGEYDGRELSDRSTDRPGAHDHEKHPSLIGNRRVWRDGRSEEVQPCKSDSNQPSSDL